MSRSFFIDTSYIIAVLSKADYNHVVAIDIAKRIGKNDKLFYTEAIMYESLNALSKARTRRAVLEFFDSLARNPNASLLHTTPTQFQAALEFYRKHLDKDWGLVDCVSFQTMKAKRIKYALTADAHFEQAGLIAVLRAPELLK